MRRGKGGACAPPVQVRRGWHNVLMTPLTLLPILPRLPRLGRTPRRVERRLTGLQKRVFWREGKVPEVRKTLFQRMPTLPTCRKRVRRGQGSLPQVWKRVFQGASTLPSRRKRVLRRVGSLPRCWKRVLRGQGSLPWVRKRVWRGQGSLPSVQKRVLRTCRTWFSLRRTIGSRMGRRFSLRQTLILKEMSVGGLLHRAGTRCVASPFQSDPTQRVPTHPRHA